jgi:two-component system cell cycle sensor histidine kinase/response regulator CckA
MTKPRSMSIRNQIVVLIILMTLLPLGIIVYTAVKQKQHDIDEAIVMTASVATQIQNDQYVLLAGAEQLAATVSSLPVVQQRDAMAVNSLLSKLITTSPHFSNVIIVDRTGFLWASAIPSKGPLSYSDRRYFKNALASGNISSGEFTIGKISQTPVLSFAYPIFDRSGAVSDVMAVVFTLDRYRHLYNGGTATPVSSILLVDHKGTILYSSVDSNLVGKQDRADLFARMTEGPNEGAFEANGNLGTRRIFSYRKLWLKGESSPYMYIRTGLNKDYVLTKARKDFMFGAGLLLPTMLVMLGMAICFFKRNILNKVSGLLDATQRIAHGDLTARVPDHISGGELGELGCAFNDMAQRLELAGEVQRESEKKLQQSEQRFRSFVENANDVVFALTPSGFFSYVSPNWTTAFGYGLDETIGQPFAPFVHADDVPRCMEYLKQVMETGDKQNGVEYRVLHKNGGWIWYKANGSLMREVDNEDAIFIGIGRDITEKKKAEETLRQSEEKFSAAFHASPDAVTLTRLSDGTFLEINTGYTALTGYQPEEAIGKTALELGIWDDPLDRVQLMRDLHDNGIVHNKEFRFKRKDGSMRTGQMSMRIIEINGELCILGITRDVTEHEYLQNELIKAQKLESIGILAGGIAHNFNNVLTGVIGYISYAKKHLGDTNKVLQILESAEKSSYRAAGLARQLLTFSQGDSPIRKPVSVDALVDESVSLFLSGSNVKGTISCTSHQIINVDSQQISQAFNNIVLNALQAMPDGGTLSVHVSSVTLHKDNRYSLQPGDYAKIIFEDSGCGIGKDDLIKIYDPYFTTKDSGTGLGLSTTHSIISKHGGHIDIASEVGKGTIVTILLPTSPEKETGDENAEDRLITC